MLSIHSGLNDDYASPSTGPPRRSEVEDPGLYLEKAWGHQTGPPARWFGRGISQDPVDRLHAGLGGLPDPGQSRLANNSGGDTPETIRAFAAGRALEVPFLYDPGGKAHKVFGFAGLPGLVVIDKAERIRFTREGYNAAETGFQDNLVELIEELRAERDTIGTVPG